MHYVRSHSRAGRYVGGYLRASNPATGLAAVAALAGRRWPPVRTGLTFGAASGNPAPGRGPAGCLPAGRPPNQLLGAARRKRHRDLTKGARAIVIGRLRLRSWETDQGEKGTMVEVEADEVAPR